MPCTKFYIFSGGLLTVLLVGVITLFVITVTHERLKMAAQTCIMCNQDSQEGRTWVENAALVSVYTLLDFAQKRAKYGEAQYTLLAENVERLSSNELEQVKHHTERYKSVVHKRMLERVSMVHLAVNYYK